MLTLAGLLALGSPAVTANAAWKTTSSGTMYTQKASPGYVTGFHTIDKKLYYFNTKGIMQKSWIALNNKHYYADPKTGVLAVDTWVDGKYYFYEDGTLAVNTWVNGKWVGADGRYTGIKNNVGWVTDNGKTYFYDATTHQPVKGWLVTGGKKYYLDPTTGALKKGWLKIGGKTYFAGPKKGYILTNQWYSGKYLSGDGSVATGWTTVGKKTYYFNSKGVRQKGWIKHNGETYYFNSKGILQKNAWVGKKYVNSKGALAHGWTTIGKYRYYFSASGTKKTGWITVDGNRYFLNKNGQLQKKRWLWSKSYYATASGAVLKGLNAVGGKLYYFDPTTGKKNKKALKAIGADHYYFQSDGTAAKNKWVKIGSKYYYFQSDAKMARSTWVGKYYVDANGVRTGQTKTTGWSTINGSKYYFDGSGNMVTGFASISGSKYYFNSSGVMQTGLQKIGGVKYYFYPQGTMAVSTTIIVGSKQYTVNSKGVITAEENLKVSGTTTGAKIVNFALQYVGNRYVYGGTSLTNGADCSGFVQTVFSNFGIKLLRVADDQMKGPSASYIKNYGYKKAVVVDISSIQPGDLLFYGSGNYASHVAIYMGNGKIVHASNSQPYPAGGIKVSNYNYQTPLKAVRYWS